MAAKTHLTTHDRICTVGLSVLACALSACEQSKSTLPPQQSNDQTSEAASPWVTSEAGAHLAISDSTDFDALQRAIDEAHRTMDDARSRWQVADADQKQNWSIKWAARTLEGGVEHVWVRPTHWSQWRIEGVLLSGPTRELESGAASGTAVSFPVDELTDWLYLIDGRVDGPRNGGFTLDLLQDTYGAPPAIR